MKKTLNVLMLYILITFVTFGQELNNEDYKEKINTSLSNIYQKTLLRPGKVTVDSIAIINRKKVIELHTNLALSYLPMREQTLQLIYDSVRFYLPTKYNKHEIKVFSDKQDIRQLVPNIYRDKTEKDKDRIFSNKVKTPLVKNISSPVQSFPEGLSNNHIAMWQSHGWYFEQKLGRWEWQRARIFQTVEDLYTQSYVLPFLVPMLENAGANVILPRERDYNKIEVIVDNNGSTGNSQYKEQSGKEKWQDTKAPGFANPKAFYVDNENPFHLGSARQTKTVTNEKESIAEWIIDIPKRDTYTVYVSYQTVKNSTDDALYTVFHEGGKTDFIVNQQMGGGTWIYLGSFLFNEGNDNKIVVTNKSKKANKIISTDAVKIGGGMGNIARLPHPDGFESTNTKSSDNAINKKDDTRSTISYKPETSGYPRYTEGARYWMQWAGVPDSIYNYYESKNDYTDDYASRGRWVNYLTGGSTVMPKDKGLNIPIDLTFAFHTDAGTYWGDSIVGTLGIYMTHFNNEKFVNGKSRWASRDLTELIMEEITNDIRREFEPEWTRRHMWNRSYAEARTPNVPTMLLELLSHQNFADMRYGLDPSFRFTVSRAIYKGMLKFISSQYNRNYTVQPLPVKDFSVTFSGDTEVTLNWKPTIDLSESSANPTKYIVYTRLNDEGFDNGVLVNTNSYKKQINKDEIYSFKIEAVNEGGRSFPSETLSACRKSEERGIALIVNGFTRVSAPFSFTAGDSIAGFVGREDNGVPYISDHQFIGQMHEYRRVIPWMDDDASGFGDSDANYETTAIAGNTFDYPYTHGQTFTNAGYSFVSSSASAIETAQLNSSTYKIVDWILGKQREWVVAHGAMPSKYKTFNKIQQEKITDYCKSGGNIIVSGAFVGTDLWDNPRAKKVDRDWAQNILKYKWRNNYGGVTGQVKTVASPFESITGNYTYYNELNSESYVVENPDAIEPADKSAYTVFRYTENNLSAGTFYKGETYNTCVLGFPIESIKGQHNRNMLVKGIIEAMGL